MSQQITVIAPLLPPSALLPLGEPGGVRYPVRNVPGAFRPYSATLAVPMPVAGKHSTSSTRPPTSIPTERSHDGKVVPDTTADTGSDS